jgi:hypothetical protein
VSSLGPSRTLQRDFTMGLDVSRANNWTLSISLFGLIINPNWHLKRPGHPTLLQLIRLLGDCTIESHVLSWRTRY